MLLAFGMFLMGLGALLAGLAIRDDGASRASLLLLVLGGVSALIGQVLVFIGVVAIGVRLGTRD